VTTMRSRTPMSTLTGTGTLLRLALRRDRVRLPLWIVAITAFVAGSAAAFPELYPTAQARASRAILMSNPTILAFRGPGYGLDDYTFGAMVAHELLLWGLLGAALMSVLIVVRHTRAEEQAGRHELVRAGVTGRHAGTTSALGAAVLANLALGVAMALSLSAIDPLPIDGSWLLGAAVAAAGIAFAAIAALTCQLTEHARGATGTASAAIGVALVLRAIGDMGDGPWAWLSPLGWSQATRVYVDGRWWPLAISLGFAAVTSAVAYGLGSRRDVGAGLLSARPGAAEASRALVSPVGLALRLHRGTLVGWTVGLLALGLSFGTVIGEIGGFLADNPQFEDVLGAEAGAALTDAFLAMIVLLLALLATGAGLQVALRPRTEEAEGRAEPLLAAAISRAGFAISHWGVALVGAGVVLLAGSFGLGTTAAIDQGDAGLLVRVVGAGIAQLPAVWLIVGVAAALYGALPRLAPLSWVLLAHAGFVGLLADVVGLPDGVRNLSPFHHAAHLPGGEPGLAAAAALVALAATGLVVGLSAFRRRDLELV
jgi:ABC-2 type transport system permease protein